MRVEIYYLSGNYGSRSTRRYSRYKTASCWTTAILTQRTWRRKDSSSLARAT